MRYTPHKFITAISAERCWSDAYGVWNMTVNPYSFAMSVAKGPGLTTGCPATAKRVVLLAMEIEN